MYRWNMGPLVSIIIPNFNNANFVIAAVQSAIAQDYSPCEIIVIDDGSTDNSLKILQSLGEHITIISILNAGAAAARNVGLNNATGAYIALLDSDDIWTQDKISKQMKMMIDFNLDLVYCGGQEFENNNTNGLIHAPIFSGNCYPYFKRFPTRAIIDLGCSSALFRKSLLKSSGLFDSAFLGAAEDWDFFRRYCRIAKVGFLPEILVHYRKHSRNISSGSKFKYYLGNRRAILKMFCEDEGIKWLEKRNVWMKFHFLSAKSLAKEGNLIYAIFLLIRIIGPINTSMLE